MVKKDWVSLTQYANKYNVSISTLRRRIKAQQVEFVYEGGKYLLLDRPLQHQKKVFDKGITRNTTNENLNIQKIGSLPLNYQGLDLEPLDNLDNQEEDRSLPTDYPNKNVDEFFDPNENLDAIVAPPQSDRNFGESIEKGLGKTLSETEKEILSDLPPVHEVVSSSEETLSETEKKVLAVTRCDLLNEETVEKSSQVKDILATTNRLLEELKKTYSLILQEKEEQLILVKDEVADLKTLVCVLEDKNRHLGEQKTTPIISSSLLRDNIL